MPHCTYLTLIVGKLPTFTLPVTTSRAATLSNLHNTCAPTLTSCLYSALEPRARVTSHLHLANDHTYTPYDERYCPSCLPIKIVGNELHTLLHCPTLPLSPNLPSKAFLVPFADMTPAPGPHTPRFNKPLFSSTLPPISSFANTTKHEPTQPRLCEHNSVQSHFLKHQPSASPGPVPSLPYSLSSPPTRGYPVPSMSKSI